MSTTEEKILIGVSRLRNLMHREMGRHFGEYNLTTAQFSILEALYSNGDLNVGEIQEKILGTPGNTPGVINTLIKSGYVAKKQDENDRRISRVSMTESGKELMASIYPHPHQEWLEEILSVLSKEEREVLAKALHSSCDKMMKQKEE